MNMKKVIKKELTYDSSVILCKAKTIEANKWIEGSYVLIKKQRITHSYIVTNDGIAKEIHPDSICRFTGYTLDGVKIWENDQIKQLQDSRFVAAIRFGTYRNVSDTSATEHVGFFVDWDEESYLRKDLGFFIHRFADNNYFPFCLIQAIL